MTTLMLATVVLFLAGVMILKEWKSENEPGIPASTEIGTWDGEQPNWSPDPQPGQPTVPQNTTASALEVQQSTTTLPPPPPPADPGNGRVECDGRLTVITPSANVRSDADKDAALVAVINEGESYDVVSQKCSSTGILWFEIKVGETTGYVAGSYVNYDGKIIGGKAYLTFDDGPSANTWRILDTLDSYGVKATFFVIYHKNQEDAYKAIVERGHTIALHSYTHSYSTIYRSSQAYFDDLQKLDDHVYSLTGVHSRIIRFPGGTSNAISAKYCKGVMTDIASRADREGYYYFDWNVDSGDAEDVTVPVNTILENIRNATGNTRNAVVLMHDASAKTTTADALPQIIEYLRSRGYELLPLSENSHPVRHKVHN